MRHPRVALLLLALAATPAACAAPTRRAPAPVAELWLTTGDGARRLARQPSPVIGADLGGPGTRITVEPEQRFQSMIGFGAALTDAAAELIQHRLAPDDRERLLRALFTREGDGIGLGMLRLTIGASDFSRTAYTLHDLAPGERDPGFARFSLAPQRDAVLPVARRALALQPQLAVIASPWSAPAWMKTTGRLAGGTLRDDAFDAYAEYLARAVAAYEAEGVPLFAITVQNEPHHEPADYPGMRLDPAQRARLLGRHLGPRLAAAGRTTRVLEWDHNWDEPASPLAVLADTAARRHVGGVAWHCYAGDPSAQSVVHDAHPDVDAYFTECSGGGWATDWGANLRWNVRTLVIGAVRHHARGVLLWNIALDTRHGPRLGGCADCRGVVTIDSATGAVTRNEEWHALAHASRFVLPGAHRVASTSDVDGVHTVAFRNPDGARVLVAVNEAGAARTLVVREGDRAVRAVLPAGSVATLRWR